MKKLLVLISVVMFFTTNTHAQRIEEVSGDAKMLKGQKSILVEYVFKDIEMGKEGKEADYLAKKKK